MSQNDGWSLKRTTQCSHCPWRKDVDPYDIPNGYDVEKHKNLIETIAEPGEIFDHRPAMACHETEDAYCIGWLNNQLGPGNNIPLRMKMRTCTNGRKMRTIGDQHERFTDTIPPE